MFHADLREKNPHFKNNPLLHSKIIITFVPDLWKDLIDCNHRKKC
jgi:hypothetical protein